MSLCASVPVCHLHSEIPVGIGAYPSFFKYPVIINAVIPVRMGNDLCELVLVLANLRGFAMKSEQIKKAAISASGFKA